MAKFASLQLSIVATAAVSLLISLSAPAVSSTGSVNSLIVAVTHKAQALISAGRFQDAVELLTSATFRTPSSAGKAQLGRALVKTQMLWGNSFIVSGANGQALRHLGLSLSLATDIEDSVDEEKDLATIGNIYDDSAQYDKALRFGRQALALALRDKDTAAQAKDLGSIGSVYDNLGQYERALGYDQQSLALAVKSRDIDQEQNDTGNISTIYENMGQYAKALEYGRRALAVDRKLRNTSGEEQDLGNIGNVYDDMNEYRTALIYDRKSDALATQVGDTRTEEHELLAIGGIYDDIGQRQKAVAYDLQGLLVQRRIGDTLAEAVNLDSLMDSEQKLGKPALAIYFGKQSVNAYQTIRASVADIDSAAEKSYLATAQGAYRQLADLLIDQGRLPEAEQVLGLLKNQELTEYVQRSAQASPSSSRLPLTPSEQALAAQQQLRTQPAIAIGEKIDELLRVADPTQSQLQQLKSCQAQLPRYEANYQAFLAGQLAAELSGAAPETKKRLTDIQNAEGALQGDLQDMGPGTVALFTLIEPTKYRVVVVTSQAEKPEEYTIPSDKLRHLVLAWRSSLENPKVDSRPLGQQLYKILIGPIEADLAEAHAKVLMWSLDDVLRYVPMAALYDGKQYLVERYQNEVFTGASIAGLDRDDNPRWRVLALGVSRPHDVKMPASDQMLRFPALPGVPSEISGIVANDGGSGTLPGDAHLDTAFTRSELVGDLDRHYSVVHIASHFYFADDYASSFLLLGDGTPFTLNTILTSGQIFQRVDLLTLSACETAMAVSGGDGHEVESFGMLAQEKGASSILASLWPVADTSTQLLMDNFYKARGTGAGAVSKAAALQAAQLSLLHDNAPADAYTQPFYWAPFVLIGDWK